MLEHLNKEETDIFLKEVKSILVPKGIIRRVVPYFDKLINHYSECNEPEKLIDYSCLVREKQKTIIKKVQYLIQGNRWYLNMYN